MGYTFNLSEPVGDIESIKFPRLTWAHYKKLTLATGISDFVPMFIKFAKPVLTDEQIDSLSGDDYEQLQDMFVHMTQRDEVYSGRQFKVRRRYAGG